MNTLMKSLLAAVLLMGCVSKEVFPGCGCAAPAKPIQPSKVVFPSDDTDAEVMAKFEELKASIQMDPSIALPALKSSDVCVDFALEIAQKVAVAMINEQVRNGTISPEQAVGVLNTVVNDFAKEKDNEDDVKKAVALFVMYSEVFMSHPDVALCIERMIAEHPEIASQLGVEETPAA